MNVRIPAQPNRLPGILFICICVSSWLRTPPLTEPEENAMVCEPTVRMMGTVGAATFNDMCDYIPATSNLKIAKITFWKYSLIFELTTPFDEDFDL